MRAQPVTKCKEGAPRSPIPTQALKVLMKLMTLMQNPGLKQEKKKNLRFLLCPIVGQPPHPQRHILEHHDKWSKCGRFIIYPREAGVLAGGGSPYS